MILPPPPPAAPPMRAPELSLAAPPPPPPGPYWTSRTCSGVNVVGFVQVNAPTDVNDWTSTTVPPPPPPATRQRELVASYRSTRVSPIATASSADMANWFAAAELPLAFFSVAVAVPTLAMKAMQIGRAHV